MKGSIQNIAQAKIKKQLKETAKVLIFINVNRVGIQECHETFFLPALKISLRMFGFFLQQTKVLFSFDSFIEEKMQCLINIIQMGDDSHYAEKNYYLILHR